MGLTIGRAVAAEYIRHFGPPRDTVPPSGGHEVRHGRGYRLQRVQWTGGGADFAGGDAQILGRGREIAVTEQPRVIIRTFLCH